MRTTIIAATALVVSVVSSSAMARTTLKPGTRALLLAHAADRGAAQSTIRIATRTGDPSRYLQGRWMKSGYAVRKAMTLTQQGKTRQAQRLLNAADRYDADTRTLSRFAATFPQRPGRRGFFDAWLEAYQSTLGAADQAMKNAHRIEQTAIDGAIRLHRARR